MSLRLERAIDEVERVDRKILMYQNLKKEALTRLKQTENEEIVKSVRSMHLNRRQILELVKGIQEGTLVITQKKEVAKSEKEGEPPKKKEQYQQETESEDGNENKTE